MTKTLLVTMLAVTMAGSAGLRAQETDQPPSGRGQGGAFAGMQRVGGEVTAVNGANVTVKTEDGATMQIVTTDNTRVMKGRGVTVKVSDLKPGDGVMAAGNLDAPNKTLHAALLFATDAAQLKELKDNLGKTYITGKVMAIDLDDARMTVERPDKVTQRIGFDETTSFKRVRGIRVGGMQGFGGGMMGAGPSGAQTGVAGQGQADGESITLADVKVGDNVVGKGSVKAGTFVPTELLVSTPRTAGARRPQAGAGVQAAPASGDPKQ